MNWLQCLLLISFPFIFLGGIWLFVWLDTKDGFNVEKTHDELEMMFFKQALHKKDKDK